MSQLDMDNNIEKNNDCHQKQSSLAGCDRYGFFGGKEYTDPKEEPRLSTKVLHSREMKWRCMCHNWESYWKNHRVKVRDRCRKGIPDSMRCEAWQRLCASPMVLVARTKVIVHDANPESNSKKTGSSLFRMLDNSFSIESNGPKQTSSIITTSPSFRLNRSNAEARRRTLLQKLYGSNSHQLDDVKAFRTADRISTMLISQRWFDSPNATYDARGSDAFLADETHFSRDSLQPGSSGEVSFVNVHYSTPCIKNNTPPLPADQAAVSNHNNSEHDTTASRLSPPPSPLSDATACHTHPSRDTAVSRIAGDLSLPPLATSTTSAPQGTGYPCNLDILRVATTIKVTPGPGATASSCSGGYASLSTDSGDGIGATGGGEVGAGDNAGSREDQYSVASYLSSQSSSSSVFWRSVTRRSKRKPSLNSAMHMISSLSVHDPLLVGDDNTATLVPHGDPDPVELYHQYCRAEGQPNVCDQIRRDIDRQFPFHELFYEKDGYGQQSLYTLLKAYSVRHPDKGYCQGQAPLAAVLLMFMPEVDAFWTFNEICERYLDAYYDEGLERVQIDAQILFALLKSSYVEVYKFLKKHSIDPILIVLEWFLCVFTRTLPWCVVLRVLDMFFCEGKVVLFRVALVLLRRMFGLASQRKECNAMDEILLRVRDVQAVVKNADEFVRETLNIGLTPRDLAQEAVRHSRQWAKKKQLRV